jgi:hypothetical protein
VLQVLKPLAKDIETWGQGLNSKGDVLGYSIEPGVTEHIGFWHGTIFSLQFTEGNRKVFTQSTQLLWNEPGLIVITDTTDNTSYLVPKPNVRLDLDSLTSGLPHWNQMVDVNNNGDLVGVGGSNTDEITQVFLLQRLPC